MNRYVLSAISILLLTLTGCSDSLQESTDNPSNGVIRLTTSIEKRAGTRGTPITSASSLSDMGLYCYHTGFDTWATAGATATPNKMNHTKWTQAANVWSTTSPVTWGTDVSIAEKFTFWGYAPYATGTDSEGNGLTIVPPVGGKGFPKLTYTVPTDITKQPDLMVAVSADKHVTASPVNLSYKHALTCIAFKAKGSGQKITAVKVKGVSATGTLSVDAAGTPTWSNLSAPGTIEYTAGLNSSEITTAPTSVDILNADGYLMMIPQTLTADAQLVVTVDNEEYAFNLNTQDIATWAPGQLLTYGIDADKCKVDVITDYRSSVYSNSYILNPSTEQDRVYKIPVGRVNEFWASPNNTYLSNNTNYSLEANDPWNVELLWATTPQLTIENPGTTGIYISKATGVGPNDYFEITVPKEMATTNRGNFTVAIHTGTGPSIAWSWHFWVTDYNPYGEAVSVENAEDDGEPWAWDLTDGSGSLFRVGPNSGIYAGKRIMDRPLGYVEGQAPLLYQFGRKDPFPNPYKEGWTGGNSYNLYKYAGEVTIRCLYGYYFGGGPTGSFETVRNPPICTSYKGEPIASRGVNMPTGIVNPVVWYNYAYNIGNKHIWNCEYYAMMNWTGMFTGRGYLWNDPNAPVGSGRKSIFDPSPFGFKLAEQSYYEELGALTYDSGLKKYSYQRRSGSDSKRLDLPLLGKIAGAVNVTSITLRIIDYDVSFNTNYYNSDYQTRYLTTLLGEGVGVTNGWYWTSTPFNAVDDTFKNSSYGMALVSTTTVAPATDKRIRGTALPLFCVEQ